MHYLYHRVPEHMQRTVLYPLNMMKSTMPEMYSREFAKYIGRLHVPEQRIPLFDNCLWNDVIFSIALDPQTLMDARRDAGWPTIPPQRYFKIDPRTLDQSKLGIYLFKPESRGTLQVSDFAAYSYDELQKYEQVPSETKKYFKHERENGQTRIRLFYRYIPHVLYNGSIDTQGLEVVTVY